MPRSIHRCCICCILILSLLFFLSCASGPAPTDTEPVKSMPDVEEVELGSLEEVQQLPPLSGRFDNIVIRRFDAGEGVRKDYPEAVFECKTALMSHLKAKNAYRAVTEESGAALPGKSLFVDMEVVDLRIASAAARFWGGAFAGASYMKVLVRLTDGSTQQVVHEKVLSSTTNPFGATWTMGASDRTLPMDFGKMIGEYLYTIVPSAG